MPDSPAEHVPGALRPIAANAQPLTDRQARYVELRANGEKPMAAGMGAGLALASLRHTVSKWERDPRIIEAVADAQEMAGTEARTTPADVLRELAILAFSTLDDYEVDHVTGAVFPAEDAPPYVMRAVQKVKHRQIVSRDTDGQPVIEYRTEFALWDKTAALKMLGEHMGMWLKRIRVEDDGEVKAALASMRDVMGKALERQQRHADEERGIADFQVAQLANASAVAVASDRPLTALRDLAARVQQAAADRTERIQEQPDGRSADDGE